jgi:hypothetical protein
MCGSYIVLKRDSSPFDAATESPNTVHFNFFAAVGINRYSVHDMIILKEDTYDFVLRVLYSRYRSVLLLSELLLTSHSKAVSSYVIMTICILI